MDSTNNDNEELFNALLNIPGTASRLTLVEDKQYVLDSVIPNYALGSEDSREYYHISDKFFPVNAIAQELASELKAEGKATLRTEYDLTDGSFQQIAQEVYRLMAVSYTHLVEHGGKEDAEEQRHRGDNSGGGNDKGDGKLQTQYFAQHQEHQFGKQNSQAESQNCLLYTSRCV